MLVLLLLSCCVEQRGIGGGICGLILANCWREGGRRDVGREGGWEGGDKGRLGRRERKRGEAISVVVVSQKLDWVLTQSGRSVALYSPLMSPVSATTTVNCFNWSREVAIVR